jgi:hypothetical protein
MTAHDETFANRMQQLIDTGKRMVNTPLNTPGKSGVD